MIRGGSVAVIFGAMLLAGCAAKQPAKTMVFAQEWSGKIDNASASVRLVPVGHEYAMDLRVYGGSYGVASVVGKVEVWMQVYDPSQKSGIRLVKGAVGPGFRLVPDLSSVPGVYGSSGYVSGPGKVLATDFLMYQSGDGRVCRMVFQSVGDDLTVREVSCPSAYSHGILSLDGRLRVLRGSSRTVVSRSVSDLD